MKSKYSPLAEVHVESSSNVEARRLASGGLGHVFTVRLPQGATVLAPSGFDPDELMALLVVIQEALA